MELKITDIIPYSDFTSPTKRVEMYEVHFTASNGYTGTVRLPQAGATEAVIWEAVRKAAAVPTSLIGKTSAEK